MHTQAAVAAVVARKRGQRNTQASVHRRRHLAASRAPFCFSFVSHRDFNAYF